MTIDFIAGCIGGAAGLIVGHPLDTVKVRLQTQSAANARYRGTFHALLTIAKQESVSGLYKGISSPLYGVSLVNAIVFGVYGNLQPFVHGAPGHNALWAHAAAGAVAGGVQSIVCSPMELVKIRMQLNESTLGKTNSWTVLKSIYKTEGGLRRGVFKGFGITLSREIPGFATYFASYEALINFLENYDCFVSDAGQVGTPGMMLAGGSAGVISWLSSFPIDVIKTRYQSDVTGAYNGVLDCARKTYQAEGYQVFTRTLPSILIRAFPMSAVTFPVVTWIMRFADSKHDDLQTGRDEIDKLLEETRNRTHETLFRFHVPIPTYRLLTQEGNKNYQHHTGFSTPGTGYFNTARYYNYACLTANCVGTREHCHPLCEDSHILIETSQQTDEQNISGPEESTEADPRTTSREFHAQFNQKEPTNSDKDLILRLDDRNSRSEATNTPDDEINEGSRNTFMDILASWFQNLNPTPIHSCQCLDECICRRNKDNDR